MIIENKFENALSAIHSTFILSRSLAYKKKYKDIDTTMRLSIRIIDLFLKNKNKTNEFEELCSKSTYILSHFNYEGLHRRSYFRDKKELTNNSLVQLKKLAIKTKEMANNNINHLKIASFLDLDNVEYLVTLMLDKENQVETFNEYLNEILNINNLS